jgi:serine O-acetyltransferase
VGARRIGTGSFLFGGCTLGAGGSRDARGVPTLGRGIVLGPGASCSGPIEVPDGTVLGPNTVAIRSLPLPGRAWVGAPAQPFEGPPESLVPRIPRDAA